LTRERAVRSRPFLRAPAGAVFLIAAGLAATSGAQLPPDGAARHTSAFHCPPEPAAAPDFREAVAWLVYPRFGLLVPVLEGTEEAQLSRAAGLVDGTAIPGVPDRRRNSVIAAHRTTFFSPFESAVTGDVVTLITGSGAEDFVIDRILTVSPDHVDLEAPTRERRLTLVTCTPFNYLGDAPMRRVLLASPRAGRHPPSRAARRTVRKKSASK
jgi:LPXTG-site transpeptidase (sortase) family protein